MLNALASPVVPNPVIKMVGLQPALAEELRRRFPEEFDIEILRDHARLSQYMEQGGLPVDAVLLGMRPEEAIRVAQRIHAMDKFMPVMIVGTPQECSPLRRTLMFSPFLGSEVVPWSSDDVDVLPYAVREAVDRRRQRLRHHHTLIRAQVRFERLPLLKPEVTHYLDQLLDFAPIGVLTVDPAGIILTLNPQAQQTLNGMDSSPLGRPLEEFFPVSERGHLSRLRAEVSHTEAGKARATLRLLGPCGSMCHVDVTFAPLSYRTGQRGWMVILQDVSPRVEAEKERQQAETDLRMHVKALRRFHEISASQDLNLDEKLDQVLEVACAQFELPVGVITRVQDQALTVLRSVGQIGGRALNPSQVPLDSCCQKTLEHVEPFTLTRASNGVCNDVKSDHEHTVNAYIGARYLVNEEVAGTLCFLGTVPREKIFTEADCELIKLISRWVGSEQQRTRAEARMRKLSGALEQTADAVMITDKERRIEYVNPAFEGLTGYSRDEVLGKAAGVLRSGFHDEKFYEQLWRIVSSGHAYRGELVNRKKDGSLYHEQRTISPLKGEGGQITHFISTGHDITKLVEAQRKDRLHQAELAHVARLSTLGEMTSGLAHELNQPLCAITTFAQTCLRILASGECKPEKIGYGLEQVLRQADFASQIFRRLRTFSRKGDMQRKAVSLREVTQEMANFVKAETLQNLTHLDLDVPAGLPPVWADPIQVEQVLLNLVRNAMDAVAECDPANRRVTVTAVQSAPGEIAMEVSDSGHGCVAEIADQLFEPFFTTKANGMGVGLGISQGIIEAHGGRLWLAKTNPDGTTFRFTLPEAQGVRDEDPVS